MANVIPAIIKDGVVQRLDETADVALVGGLDSAGDVDINRHSLIGRNLADSADLDILHINADDQAEFGIDLALMEWEWPEDSGVVTVMDMSVSATPAAGTEESYQWAIDGIPIFKAFAEADSSGAIQSEAFQVLKGLHLKAVTVADGNYTILDNDYAVHYTSLTAARVLNVPAAVIALGSPTLPRYFHVKDKSGSCSGVNTITITPLGGATIDGAASLALNNAYASTVFFTDGTNLYTE